MMRRPNILARTIPAAIAVVAASWVAPWIVGAKDALTDARLIDGLRGEVTDTYGEEK